MGYKDQSPLTRLLRQDPEKLRSDSIDRIKMAFPNEDLNYLLQLKKTNSQEFRNDKGLDDRKEVALLEDLVKSLQGQVKLQEEKIKNLEAKFDKSKKTSQDFIND